MLKPVIYTVNEDGYEPAAFRRLCVETLVGQGTGFCYVPSRLQAAVC